MDHQEQEKYAPSQGFNWDANSSTLFAFVHHSHDKPRARPLPDVGVAKNQNFLARRPEVIGPFVRSPPGSIGMYANLDLTGADEAGTLSPTSGWVAIIPTKTVWLVTEKNPDNA